MPDCLYNSEQIGLMWTKLLELEESLDDFEGSALTGIGSLEGGMTGISDNVILTMKRLQQYINDYFYFMTQLQTKQYMSIMNVLDKMAKFDRSSEESLYQEYSFRVGSQVGYEGTQTEVSEGSQPDKLITDIIEISHYTEEAE